MRRRAALAPLLFGLRMSVARGLPIVAIFFASLTLDPTEFGQLSIVVVGMTVAVLLADSGSDAGATWLASRHTTSEQQSRTLGALTWTRGVIALVATAILVLPPLISAVGMELAALFAVLMAICGNLIAGVNGATRIGMRLREHGESRSFLLEKTVVSGAFLLWLAVGPDDLEGLVCGYVASCALGPCVALIDNYRLQAPILWRTTLRDVFANIKATMPFTVSLVLTTVVWRLSTYVLAWNGESAEVGFLTLAYYPVLAISTIPVASAPLLLLRSYKDRGEHLDTLRVAAAAGLVSALMLGVAIVVCAALVDETVVRPAVWSTTAILAGSIPFLWVNPTLGNVLRSHHGLWSATPAVAIGAMVALVLIAVLLPQHGAEGAAVVVVASEAATCGVLVATWKVLSARVGSGATGRA